MNERFPLSHRAVKQNRSFSFKNKRTYLIDRRCRNWHHAISGAGGGGPDRDMDSGKDFGL